MRICPNCKCEMDENSYLSDRGIRLSDVHIIRHNDDYTKTDYPLKAAICPSCGHVEFYVELHPEKIK